MFDKNILAIGCVGGLMYVPISSFAELWAIPFLMKSLQVDNKWASFASSMIFIGMAIGSPLIAKWAEVKDSYIKIMRITCLISVLFFGLITWAQYFGYWITFAMLLVSGIILGGQVLCFSVVKIEIPNKISATALAYTNMLVMLSGVLFQPLLGWFLDLGWDGDTSLTSGARTYSAGAYRHAMFAIPACLALAYFILKKIKDKSIAGKI